MNVSHCVQEILLHYLLLFAFYHEEAVEERELLFMCFLLIAFCCTCRQLKPKDKLALKVTRQVNGPNLWLLHNYSSWNINRASYSCSYCYSYSYYQCCFISRNLKWSFCNSAITFRFFIKMSLLFEKLLPHTAQIVQCFIYKVNVNCQLKCMRIIQSKSVQGLTLCIDNYQMQATRIFGPTWFTSALRFISLIYFYYHPPVSRLLSLSFSLSLSLSLCQSLCWSIFIALRLQFPRFGSRELSVCTLWGLFLLRYEVLNQVNV